MNDDKFDSIMSASAMNGAKRSAARDAVSAVQVSYRGEACVVGFGPEYTFDQLKRDAAGRWCLDANLIQLRDVDRFAFPSSERIEPWVTALRDNTVYVTHLNAGSQSNSTANLRAGMTSSSSSASILSHSTLNNTGNNNHDSTMTFSTSVRSAQPIANRTASVDVAPQSITSTSTLTSSLPLSSASNTNSALAPFPLSAASLNPTSAPLEFMDFRGTGSSIGANSSLGAPLNRTSSASLLGPAFNSSMQTQPSVSPLLVQAGLAPATQQDTVSPMLVQVGLASAPSLSTSSMVVAPAAATQSGSLNIHTKSASAAPASISLQSPTAYYSAAVLERYSDALRKSEAPVEVMQKSVMSPPAVSQSVPVSVTDEWRHIGMLSEPHMPSATLSRANTDLGAGLEVVVLPPDEDTMSEVEAGLNDSMLKRSPIRSRDAPLNSSFGEGLSDDEQDEPFIDERTMYALESVRAEAEEQQLEDEKMRKDELYEQRQARLTASALNEERRVAENKDVLLHDVAEQGTNVIQWHLWRLFTHYACMANTTEIDMMTSMHFFKLLKDSGILPSTVSSAPGRINKRDIDAILAQATAVSKQSGRLALEKAQRGGDNVSTTSSTTRLSDHTFGHYRITFDVFLGALLRIATRMRALQAEKERGLHLLYLPAVPAVGSSIVTSPTGRAHTSDDQTVLESMARRSGIQASQIDLVKEHDMFLQLLSTHILPLAEKQIPSDPIATFIQTEAVESVCVHFKEFLVKIFELHAILPGQLPKRIDEEDDVSLQHSVQDLELEFHAFVSMCRRFELVSPQVTNSALGRLFATCLDDPLGFEPTGAHATLDASMPRVRLTLPEFVEALCRCALIGSENDPRLSSPLHVADKIRGLFAHVYKASLLRRASINSPLLHQALVALKSAVHRVWEREQRVSVETGISATPPMRGDRAARILAAAQMNANPASPQSAGGKRNDKLPVGTQNFNPPLTLNPTMVYMTEVARASETQVVPVNVGNTEYFRDILIHSTKLRLAHSDEDKVEKKETPDKASVTPSLPASSFSVPPQPLFAQQSQPQTSMGDTVMYSSQPNLLSLSMMNTPAPPQKSSNSQSKSHLTSTGQLRNMSKATLHATSTLRNKGQVVPHDKSAKRLNKATQPSASNLTQTTRALAMATPYSSSFLEQVQQPPRSPLQKLTQLPHGDEHEKVQSLFTPNMHGHSVRFLGNFQPTSPRPLASMKSVDFFDTDAHVSAAELAAAREAEASLERARQLLQAVELSGAEQQLVFIQHVKPVQADWQYKQPPLPAGLQLPKKEVALPLSQQSVIAAPQQAPSDKQYIGVSMSMPVMQATSADISSVRTSNSGNDLTMLPAIHSAPQLHAPLTIDAPSESIPVTSVDDSMTVHDLRTPTAEEAPGALGVSFRVLVEMSEAQNTTFQLQFASAFASALAVPPAFVRVAAVRSGSVFIDLLVFAHDPALSASSIALHRAPGLPLKDIQRSVQLQFDLPISQSPLFTAAPWIDAACSPKFAMLSSSAIASGEALLPFGASVVETVAFSPSKAAEKVASQPQPAKRIAPAEPKGAGAKPVEPRVTFAPPVEAAAAPSVSPADKAVILARLQVLQSELQKKLEVKEPVETVLPAPVEAAPAQAAPAPEAPRRASTYQSLFGNARPSSSEEQIAVAPASSSPITPSRQQSLPTQLEQPAQPIKFTPLLTTVVSTPEEAMEYDITSPPRAARGERKADDLIASDVIVEAKVTPPPLPQRRNTVSRSPSVSATDSPATDSPVIQPAQTEVAEKTIDLRVVEAKRAAQMPASLDQTRLQQQQQRLRVLQNGALFVKHCEGFGSPHARFFRVTPSVKYEDILAKPRRKITPRDLEARGSKALASLQWGVNSVDAGQNERNILLADLISAEAGTKSKSTFFSRVFSSDEEAANDRSFTLKTLDRDLKLVAPDAASAALWLEFFVQLLRDLAATK